jgi:Protein of unknown function (DUF998)
MAQETRVARTLLACGVAAGPLYIGLGLLQMAIRPGFDIRRHPLSLLSNGELGWIQIANFLLTGALILAAGAGLRIALRSGPGRTWAALMVGLYGLGLIGAGIFSADPALGFPPGTPEENNPISFQGVMHFVAGTFGFAGFIAACFIFARRFKAIGEPAWSRFSLTTGVVFLAGFLAVASGSRGASPYFAVAVLLGFVWLSAVLGRVRATIPA